MSDRTTDLAEHTRALATSMASTVLYTAVMFTDTDDLSSEGITGTIDAAAEALDGDDGTTSSAVRSLLVLAREMVEELEL